MSWKREILKLIEPSVVKHINELRDGGAKLKTQFKLELPDGFKEGEYAFPILTYSEDEDKYVQVGTVTVYVGPDLTIKPEDISIYLTSPKPPESVAVWKRPRADNIWENLKSVFDEFNRVIKETDWSVFTTVASTSNTPTLAKSHISTVQQISGGSAPKQISSGNISVFKGVDWRTRVKDDDRNIVSILERSAPKWWRVLEPPTQEKLIGPLINAYRQYRSNHAVFDTSEFWDHVTDELTRSGHLVDKCTRTAQKIPTRNGICAISDCPSRVIGGDGKCVYQTKSMI